MKNKILIKIEIPTEIVKYKKNLIKTKRGEINTNFQIH